MLLGIQIEVVVFFRIFVFVQALQAARVHTFVFRCEKAMRHILTFQNDQGEDVGSFGSILANIQVTPALLGESLISLKRYSCPPGKRE
jgi:hypothetical protein